MFQVIPAIDVAGGALAVYTADGPVPVASFDGDPLTAARAYVAAGVRWIHVVDMDLAFDGTPANLGVIKEIAALGVRIQASGGVRDPAVIDGMLAAGASRVVLGSGAFADEGVAQELIAVHGDRLVLGVEVEEGRIRSRGADPVDLELVETLGWLAAAGAKRFLV
ncbi:MAG: HisA/HisF-related TIM barrel protein, partial [Actinomycetota bacterium]